MTLVPTMANALLNCPDLGKFDTSSMKVITTGGAASSPELIARLEQAFHCDVCSGYGLTETCSGAYHGSDEGHRDLRERRRPAQSPFSGGLANDGLGSSCGRFADARRSPRPQAVGEVVVRGDIVMDGYYNEPEATEAVITDGWLHTGDMAVWDEENYVYIVDRKKDIIISGGENISSIEVEKAIFAHPAVLECAVVSAPDPQWGEIPVAIVVLKPNQQLRRRTIDVVSEATHRQIQNAASDEVRGRTLPKTGTGKMLKRELREAFWSGKATRVQG